MYLDILWLLNFLVDLLLLIATNRLSGYPTKVSRTLLAALIGGFYGSCCVIPGLMFLGWTIWRVVFLGLMGCIAFGISKDTIRRTVLFIILSMALGGVALGIGHNGFITILLGAVAVCLMCVFGLHGKIGNRFLPVEIFHNGKLHRFTAMIDTGNTLIDPISGQQVMVVSSSLGQQLLGQGNVAFSDPISALKYIPGSRLIPYNTIGSKNGLLLSKRFQNVNIGKWSGECLIAFSPQEFGKGEAYEALTGGNLWV